MSHDEEHVMEIAALRLQAVNAAGQEVGGRQRQLSAAADFDAVAHYEAADLFESAPEAHEITADWGTTFHAVYTRQTPGMSELIAQHAIGRTIAHLFWARQAFGMSLEDAALYQADADAEAAKAQLLELVQGVAPDTIVEGIVAGLNMLDG